MAKRTALRCVLGAIARTPLTTIYLPRFIGEWFLGELSTKRVELHVEFVERYKGL